MTQYLGFPNYGDEYKMMGLAPYGEARHMGEMRHIVRLHGDGTFSLNTDYFRHHKEKVSFEMSDGAPVIDTLYTLALEDLLGPAHAPGGEIDQRRKDLAHSVQAVYEEAFFNLLNHLHDRHGLDNLALAGGCGYNSVANGKIGRNTPFRRSYVQCAAGDAGGAVGAAFHVLHQVIDAPRGFVMAHGYWGPRFGDGDLRALLEAHRGELDAAGCETEQVTDEAELCRRTAEAIAGGNVVGWFQGRLEWGPRALGNRSILGDPRRADMKNILNQKIKRRESFRPFAPSILREAVPDWFEVDDDVPFMMKVFPIREDKREAIPAVTHVDGTGRLQTVKREENERYYRLIEAFGELTGVPLVLNTSFNENEPIVCLPSEALDCFLRTRMDVLVLGDYFVERRCTE